MPKIFIKKLFNRYVCSSSSFFFLIVLLFIFSGRNVREPCVTHSANPARAVQPYFFWFEFCLVESNVLLFVSLLNIGVSLIIITKGIHSSDINENPQHIMESKYVAGFCVIRHTIISIVQGNQATKQKMVITTPWHKSRFWIFCWTPFLLTWFFLWIFVNSIFLRRE